MKKTNYLLLLFASIVFALCVSSFADENDVSLTPKQKLAANIEKYAAEKEIKDSLQASREYHRNSPKEEWLPIWKEIILNGTLAESVTNWLDFAKVPLFVLCQVDDPIWPDDSHFLNIATDFKKLCEEPGHFTLDDFSAALLKMRTNGNCCYPTGNVFSFFSKNEQKKWATKNSYHFFNICDVLILLGQTKEIENIVSAWLEGLKKANYNEFVQTNYKSRCLGDIDSTFNDIPLISGSIDDIYYDCDFSIDWTANPQTINALISLKGVNSVWFGLSGLAQHCRMHALFLKGLKEAAEVHSNYFPLAKFYCGTLVRYGNYETAREFLNKYYPFEKICKMPCAYEGYVSLCNELEMPIYRSGREPGGDCNVVMWQLYSNAHQFCEWGEWFWKSDRKHEFDSYSKAKRKIAKPMLEGLDYHSEYTIRRLGEQSDIEDFKDYLGKKFKEKSARQKQPNNAVAFELAVITDDPEDFAKAVEVLTHKEPRLSGECLIRINEAEVSCIITNLRDDFPASCAKGIMELIKASNIAANPDFPYYADKFRKWCDKLGETDVVSELDKLISETKAEEPEWKNDPRKFLDEKISKTENFFSTTKEQLYYKNIPQREWMPAWKKILVSGDLSQSVSNWLIFAKFPMPNLNDSSGTLKRELNDRFRKYCEENGQFTFNEFVDALVKAPVSESIDPVNSAGWYSDIDRAERLLNSLTFYQIADALVFLGCTNEIPRLATRLMKSLDFSKSGELDLREGGEICSYQRGSMPVSSPNNTPDVWGAFCFCNDYKDYGACDAYEKSVKEIFKEHPNEFQLLRIYCSYLVEQNRGEEAWDFVRNNYPPEKFYPVPGAVSDCNSIRAELHNYFMRKFFGIDEEKRMEECGVDKFFPDYDELDRNSVKAQMEQDIESFLTAYWFWFDLNQKRIAMAEEVVKPYILAMPKQSFNSLRRLGQISETNWFKDYVNAGWEKEKTLPFAVEKVCLTEDPQEFEELVAFLAEGKYSNKGDICFLIGKLDEKTPASCAQSLLSLIKTNKLTDEYNALEQLQRFTEWCEGKGESAVAEEVKAEIARGKTAKRNR